MATKYAGISYAGHPIVIDGFGELYYVSSFHKSYATAFNKRSKMDTPEIHSINKIGKRYAVLSSLPPNKKIEAKALLKQLKANKK